MDVDIRSEIQEARFLKCIGEPTRLSILRLLCDGEVCVGDICQSLRRDQPLVSHHLRALRECGIVATRQEMQKVYYRLADPSLMHFISMCENIVRTIKPCQSETGCCGNEETPDAAAKNDLNAVCPVVDNPKVPRQARERDKREGETS